MRFSIITPSFNQAAYLPECVESVRAQAGVDTVGGAVVPPFSVEHLVQDGGSADGTVEWLEGNLSRINGESGTADPEQVHTLSFVSGPDRGQTDAINRGLARSTGEVLSYLCSDDYLLPGALARVAGVFAGHPELDVVYGDYAFLEGDSGWVRRKRVGPFSVERLRRDNFISQPATFWRRRVYERFGGFDESLRFCMDHEYWLRIAGSTSWSYLPEMLAVQRLHGDSKTGSQLVEAWEETALMAGRYGLGDAFGRRARTMRWYGAACYTAKRRFFRSIGRWVS